jgi:hypothetical protein
MRRFTMIQKILAFFLVTIPLSFVLDAGEHGRVAEGQASFTDPFAYCRDVGKADEPTILYAGPEMPDVIVEGLRKVLDIPDDAPMEQGTFWRCMDGKVWACFVGANLPCTAKADVSREPSPEMTEFCREQPDSDFIPAYVTGRETVYVWRCKSGSPEIVKQWVEPDARGFLSSIWYEIDEGKSER